MKGAWLGGRSRAVVSVTVPLIGKAWPLSLLPVHVLEGRRDVVHRGKLPTTMREQSLLEKRKYVRPTSPTRS